MAAIIFLGISFTEAISANITRICLLILISLVVLIQMAIFIFNKLDEKQERIMLNKFGEYAFHKMFDNGIAGEKKTRTYRDIKISHIVHKDNELLLFTAEQEVPLKLTGVLVRQCEDKVQVGSVISAMLVYENEVTAILFMDGIFTVMLKSED